MLRSPPPQRKATISVRVPDPVLMALLAAFRRSRRRVVTPRGWRHRGRLVVIRSLTRRPAVDSFVGQSLAHVGILWVPYQRGVVVLERHRTSDESPRPLFVEIRQPFQRPIDANLSPTLVVVKRLLAPLVPGRRPGSVAYGADFDDVGRNRLAINPRLEVRNPPGQLGTRTPGSVVEIETILV